MRHDREPVEHEPIRTGSAAEFEGVEARVEATAVGDDGRPLIETVDRGKPALRWIDRLRGRSLLRVVE